jgi:hypothetical protein
MKGKDMSALTRVGSIVFGLLVAASGCQGNSETPAAAEGSAMVIPATFSVNYNRSGGMLGYADALVVDSAGKSAAIRNEQVESFVLAEEQLAELHHQLESLDFEAMKRPPEGPQRGGADYLTYTLVYGEQSITKTDLDMPDQLRPVIQYLNSLLDAHLAPLAPKAEDAK